MDIWSASSIGERTEEVVAGPLHEDIGEYLTTKDIVSSRPYSCSNMISKVIALHCKAHTKLQKLSNSHFEQLLYLGIGQGHFPAMATIWPFLIRVVVQKLIPNQQKLS